MLFRSDLSDVFQVNAGAGEQVVGDLEPKGAHDRAPVGSKQVVDVYKRQVVDAA